MPRLEEFYAPLGIQIFPIFLCNLKCTYCVNNLNKNKRKIYVTKLNSDEWIRALQRINVKNKIWWLGGEPLLWKDLCEVSNSINHEQIILTNLYDNVEKIFELNRDKIQLYISLHPFGNDNYSIECVKQNILKVKENGFKIHDNSIKIVCPPGENLSDDILNISNIAVLDFVGPHDGKYYVHQSNAEQSMMACAQNNCESVICPVRNNNRYFAWIGPQGDMYSCYTGLVSEDSSLIIGNIFSGIYSKQKYVYCKDHYGQCEPCDFSSYVEVELNVNTGLHNERHYR